jgi:O-antigen/teichoic acid export membrane protein
MMIYVRGRYGRFFAAFDWPLFKAQIGNALPFGVGGIVAIVQNDMHNYFVSHHFDPATFAIYSIGCFQLPILGMLAGSFASALNPELAAHKEAGDHRAIIQLWMEVIGKLAFFFVPAFAVLLVLRREFITALFTTTYLASVPIFTLNLVSILIGVLVHMHVFRLFEELKYFRLKLYLVLIPVTWGALSLGLHWRGLMGVAVAAVCMQLLDLTLTLAMINRELKVTRRDLRQLTSVLRVAAAAGVAALLTIGAKSLLPHAQALVIFVICGALFGLVYLPTAFAVGAVSEEEKATLRKLWNKLARHRALRVSSATEC